MQTTNHSAPSFHYEILDKGDKPTMRGATSCLLGTDVKIKSEALYQYCVRNMEAVDFDLFNLIAAIAYADRKSRRCRGAAWERSIKITLRVHDPKHWKSQPVMDTLLDCLSFLTGDNWHFNFLPRKLKATLPVNKSIFQLPEGRYMAMPYSDGLDSFAQAQLLKIENPEVKLIRVNTRGRAQSKLYSKNAQRLQGIFPDEIPIPVPFISPTGTHLEPTYRTRAFLFNTLAALSIIFVGEEKVIVAENGQGSLGPSLVPFGNEWPHRSTHPGFTWRLSLFIKALLAVPVHFEHRRIWETKGQILKILRDKELDKGWELTNSCSLDQRTSSANGKRIPCGICGGCLLRRFAIKVAGYTDDKTDYLFGQFNDSSLEEAMHLDACRPFSKNDNDIAGHGILALQKLSDLSVTSKLRLPTFDRLLFDLGMSIPNNQGDIEKKLTKLVITHNTEWEEFIASLSTNSWVKRMAQGDSYA